MKRISTRVWLLLSLMAALPVAGVQVWFSSAPSNVSDGQSYYIEANAYVQWWYGDVNVYKNGSFVSGNGGSGYFSSGTWQSDSGPQTIEYFAEAWDWGTGENAVDWRYVTIDPPANQAPFGICDYAHSSVPVGGNLHGSGWAVDNEMGAPITRVDILVDGNDVGDANLGGDRPDVANAYGRSDYRYSGWNFDWGVGGLAAGTHTLELRAWDNQGASSTFGYRTFTVTNYSPSNTLTAPNAQTIALGTTLSIGAHATDPDGNITTHNLDIQRPDGTWNWNGGFAYGEPFMGGPVGSAADSTRTASFTFNQVGTWYVRSWVCDANSNNIHSATVAITVYNPNQPPTASLSLSASSAYVGDSVTATLTVADADGNMDYTNLWVSTPAYGWRWIHTDNSVVTGGALDRNHTATIYGATGTFTRTFTFTPDSGVGTYTFALAAVDTQGARGDASNQVVSVTMRPVTVTLAGSKTYDGSTTATGASASITTGSLRAGDTISYVYAATSSANAGSYSGLTMATIRSASNVDVTATHYTVTYAGSYTINKANQAALTATAAPSTVAYGNSSTLSTTGGSGSGVVTYAATAGGNISGSTFTATSSSGTSTITATKAAETNYNSQTGTTTITLVKRDITVTLTGSKTYDGTTVSTGASASITAGTLRVGDTISFGYAATSSANAGSYPGLATATIKDSGNVDITANYNITYAGAYTINKANQAALVASANPTSVGIGLTSALSTTGGSGTGAVTYTATAGGSISGSTFTATASSGISTVTATKAADTNYNATTATVDITLTKRPLTVTLAGSKTYDGTTASTGASASITSGTLRAGDSITYSYAVTSSANAGNYSGIGTATVRDAGSVDVTSLYQLTYAGTYTIGKANQPTVSVTGPSSTIYGNSPTATASGGNGTGAYVYALGTGSTASGASVTSAGVITASSSGTVVIKVQRAADTNYNVSAWSVDYTVTVSKRDITVAGGGAKVYDGTTASTGATANITVGTLATGDSLGVTFGPASSANVNSYSVITAVSVTNGSAPTTRTGSYNITVNGSYAISPRPITAATITTLVYSGAAQSPSTLSSVTPFGATVTVSAPAQTNAGTYATATVSGTGNYGGTLSNVSWTINPATISAATIAPLTYTGSAQSPTSASSVTPSGATVSVSAPAQTNAGTYTTATVTGTGSYNGTLSNVSWTINKANQSAAVTITSAATSVYQMAYTATATGGNGTGAIQWSLGTGSTAAGAAINATTGAVTTTGAGLVKIKARRLGDANYNDSAWTADFTISVATLDLTITLAGSKVADGTTTATNASASITSGALYSGDTISYTFNATSSTDTGTYTGLTVPVIRNSSNTDVTSSYNITHAGSYDIRPAPTVAAGLRAWYTADYGITKAGDGSVSTWKDASGNEFHLSQATTTAQPFWSASVANSKPAIQFNNGERLKTAAAVNLQSGADDLTVIAVIFPDSTQLTGAAIADLDVDNQQGFSLAQNSTTTNQFITKWRNQALTNTQGATAPTANAALAMHVLSFVKGGTTQTSYRNGVQQATATVEATMNKPTAIFAVGGASVTAGTSFNGWVAEILVYNRALTSTERQQVENAILTKYGLSATDVDGDGIPDAWESSHAMNSLNPADAAQDRDHDGLTNLQEYQQGRDIDWADNPAINLTIYSPSK